MLAIRLLGAVGVEVDGRPVSLPAKPRALLALLALSAGRVVTVAQAVDGLWGEDVPASARNALQVHVSGLRRALGADGQRVRTVPAGYQLDSDGDEVEIDLVSFRALVERSSSAGPAAAKLLREATDLWRGPPLADLSDVPFVGACVTGLIEEQLVAVERRLDAELLADKTGDVVIELEKLVTTHPFREGLWHRLVLALYRSERQADALAAYRRARTILRTELGLDPGPSLQALEQAVLRGDPALLARPSESVASTASIPSPSGVDELVGRSRDIARLSAAVAAHPLVTVTGPGGVGKTRLIVELARQVPVSLVDAVMFVDLSDVRDADAVGGTIARALGLPASDPWEQLAGHLRRARVLLVLDNLEQVAAGNAARIAALTHPDADSRIVITSRVPLHAPGETLVPLEPLAAEDAEHLFALHARIAHPGVLLDAATVSDLCRRLDRLPLALELAASRCRLMTPAQLLGHLDRILRADSPPTSADERTPHRQRSVIRSVVWSVDLLSAEATSLLTELGVFCSPFDWDALEAICGASELNVVEELLDAGLVLSDGSRLHMLETVRFVARELLDGSGNACAIRDRHAAWALAEATTLGGALRPQPVDRVAEGLRAILEECLSAVEHLLATDRPESAAELLLLSSPAWSNARDEYELTRSLSWLTRLVSCPLLPATRVRIQLHRQDRLFFLGRVEESLATVRTAYDDAVASGFDWGIARACHALAYRAMSAGDHVESARLCHEGADAALRAGDELLAAGFDNILGCSAMDQRDYDRAERHLRSFVDASTGRDRRGVLVGLGNLVDAAIVCGRPEEARQVSDELWLVSPIDQHGAASNLVQVCRGLAALAAGDRRWAAQCFASSLDRRLADGYSYGLVGEVIALAAIARSAGDPGRAEALLRAAVQLRHHEPAVGSEWLAVDLLEQELTVALGGLVEGPGRSERSSLPASLDVSQWRAVAIHAAASAHELAQV